VASKKKDRNKETSANPPRESQERLAGRASFSSGGSTPGGKAEALPAGGAGRGGRRSWLQTHGRDLRFLGFFSLFLIVFFVLTLIPGVRETVFPGYLRINAVAASAILNSFGEGTEVRDHSIVSSRFQVSIERGCDAIEPSALFCAAVLASPVALLSRLSAVLVGTVLLMLINFVRILTLYYTGAYARWAFDVMHLDVWQALFIFLAILFWALWASWQKKGKPAVKAHASN
jgi:exosortase/archaeosortase family protein